MNNTFRRWFITALLIGFIGISSNSGVKAMLLLEPTPTLTPSQTEKTTQSTPKAQTSSTKTPKGTSVSGETNEDKKPMPAPTDPPDYKPSKPTETEGYNWIGLIYYLAIGLLSLLVIAGLVTLVLLFRSSWQNSGLKPIAD